MKYISPRQFGEIYLILEKIDMAYAKEAHEKLCEHCGGKLDIANYWRKIRGIGEDQPVIRHGLCCRNDGCRKRATVQSIRFIGGFIYSSFFTLLASVLLTGDLRRFKNIVRRLSVSPRTLKRWKHFWDEIFEKTIFWKEQKGKSLCFFHKALHCK